MIRWMQGILVGAVVALAVVAIVMVRWSSSGANRDVGQSAASVPAWSSQWADQSADGVAVETRVGNGSGSADLSSVSAAPKVAGDVAQTSAVKPRHAAELASPLDALEPGQSRQERLLAKLETQFAGEVVDEFWSTQTGDRITGYFAEAASNDEGNGSVLGDVQCHSSLCRVEVVHDNEQALQQFALTFPMQMAEALPRITYQTEPRNDGRVAMVMYLSSGAEAY